MPGTHSSYRAWLACHAPEASTALYDGRTRHTAVAPMRRLARGWGVSGVRVTVGSVRRALTLTLHRSWTPPEMDQEDPC